MLIEIKQATILYNIVNLALPKGIKSSDLRMGLGFLAKCSFLEDLKKKFTLKA